MANRTYRVWGRVPHKWTLTTMTRFYLRMVNRCHRRVETADTTDWRHSDEGKPSQLQLLLSYTARSLVYHAILPSSRHENSIIVTPHNSTIVTTRSCARISAVTPLSKPAKLSQPERRFIWVDCSARSSLRPNGTTNAKPWNATLSALAMS